MFLRPKSAVIPPAPPPLTLADRVAQAHAAWELAEVKLADACTALNRFRATHPAHIPVKRIGNDVWLQFTPADPRLIALSSAENHARTDRDNKQRIWSDLYRELYPETRYVAGVRQ